MTDRARLRLQFLGAFAAASGAEDVTAAIAQPKRLALLIWLELSRPRGLHPRDTLCGLLWPESPNDKARAALRQLLLVLRRDLGEDIFVSEGELVGINAGRVTSDVGEVLDALERGDDLGAVAAFAGELLPGLPFAEGDYFERWLEQRRSDLRRAVVQASWREVERAESRGDSAEALRLAEWAFATDQTDEPGLRRVMTLQAQHGDRTAALRGYRRYADHLRQDWDAEPEEPTRLLYERIKEGDLALAPADSVRRSGADAHRQPEADRERSDSLTFSQEAGKKEVPPAQRRLRRLLVGLGVTVAVVAVAAAGLWGRGARKPPGHTRLVVLPFENRTGDVTWDHLSLLASDYVAQSLLQTGLLQVVPMSAASQVTHLFRAQPEADGTALPQRVAGETGAGLALSGAYYLVGDSLRFVVELTDAVGEKLLASPEPVLASRKDPMPGLERLRRLIAGTLAIWVDPAMRQDASQIRSPPSYETAKLMQEGFAAYHRDFREAARLFQRAFAMDTTYEPARLWQAMAHLDLGEWDTADSLVQLSERNQFRLGPSEKAFLGFQRAGLDGDPQARYRMIKAQSTLTPGFQTARQLGFETSKLNRPTEALEILAQVDPTSPQMTGSWTYWWHVVDAHHVLGRHDQELAVARKARNQYPDLLSSLWFEAQALAALGRVDEVNQLLDQSVNFAAQSLFTPGLLAMWSGLELLAHGDSISAGEAFDRSVSWYQRLPHSGRGTELSSTGLPGNGGLMSYGEALYFARQFAKAGEVFAQACSKIPDTPSCLGWDGVVKARQGQRDQALAAIDAIGRTDSTPRIRVQDQAYHQARIAAVLGDRAGAVELLRRAFTHGLNHGEWTHRDYDFHTLLDYPPFQELIKPKD